MMRGLKVSSQKAIGLSLLVVLFLGLVIILKIFHFANGPAGQTNRSPNTPELGYTGPKCFIVTGERYSLWLPAGWHARNPTSNLGTATIYNYVPEEIKFDHGVPLNQPENYIIIQTRYFEYNSTQTLENWIAGEIERTEASVIGQEVIQVSQPVTYELGSYEGYIMAVIDPAIDDERWIVVEVVSGQGITIILNPASSPALSDAMTILSTLNASETPACPCDPDIANQDINSILDFVNKFNRLFTYSCVSLW